MSVAGTITESRDQLGKSGQIFPVRFISCEQGTSQFIDL